MKLVDDDEAVLKATQGLLSEFGYTVAAFSSAAEAMETYLKDPDRFDIVVTDMTMPGMTGLELSKRILGLNPDKPVILCTGFSESMNREKAIAIGVAEFYQKPIITWEIAKSSGPLWTIVSQKTDNPILQRCRSRYRSANLPEICLLSPILPLARVFFYGHSAGAWPDFQVGII
jgi:FixJ family two-component response regulator